MFFDEADFDSLPATRQRDMPLSFEWKGITDELLLRLAIPRGKHIEAYRGAIGCLLIADLLGTCVSYSRSRNHYTGLQRYGGGLYTYAIVVKVVSVLGQLGLVEEERMEPRSFGVQSRMRASQRLRDIAGSAVILMPLHAETIRLKDASKRLIPYLETEQTREMRRRLAKHNEALSALNITSEAFDLSRPALLARGRPIMPIRRALYRVFNGDFLHGGRLYGGFWQNLRSEHRKELAIEGERVVEVDYRHLHPDLLHAAFGRVLDFDAYCIEGVARTHCKLAFQMLLNCSTKQAAIGAMAAALHASDDRLDFAFAKQRAREILKALEKRHQAIDLAFYQVIGRRLQKVDSELILRVMDCCATENIVGLPVHDSLIVPQGSAQRVGSIMNEQLERIRDQLRRIGIQGLLNPAL